MVRGSEGEVEDGMLMAFWFFCYEPVERSGDVSVLG